MLVKRINQVLLRIWQGRNVFLVLRDSKKTKEQKKERQTIEWSFLYNEWYIEWTLYIGTIVVLSIERKTIQSKQKWINSLIE